MTKGKHSTNWFIQNVGKEILNVRTMQTFLIQDLKHAKQLFLYQNLNNQKYILTNDCNKS